MARFDRQARGRGQGHAHQAVQRRVFDRLAAGQDAELNQYLAFTEPVTVQVGDTVYKLEPDSAKP